MIKREYKYKTVLVEISTIQHPIYNKETSTERVIGQPIYNDIQPELLEKLVENNDAESI